MEAAPPSAERARYVGVGCVTALGGLFSGGMIAVLVAKVVGSARGCEPPQGLPACDWYYYAVVGMVFGAVTLPLLTIRRLMRGDADARISNRG